VEAGSCLPDAVLVLKLKLCSMYVRLQHCSSMLYWIRQVSDTGMGGRWQVLCVNASLLGLQAKRLGVLAGVPRKMETVISAGLEMDGILLACLKGRAKVRTSGCMGTEIQLSVA
jgi:hypothetical protein